MVRLFLKHRLLLAALVTSALVGVACAKVNTSGNLQQAAATTHVLVDAPDASIVDRRVLQQDINMLQKRAEMYARLLVTPPVLEAVGRRAGVPGNQISGVARTTADVPIPLTEPGSEERANQIQDSRAPYRLELQSDSAEPILAIYAQAPSPDDARRLADSAVLGLRDYLRALGQGDGFGEREVPQLRQLGAARGGVINARAQLVIGGLTFILAFALSFILLLGLLQLRRRQSPAEAPPAASRPALTGAAVADWPRTTRLLPWAVAGFITMIWLTPFDKIQLAGNAPIDLTLDRLILPCVAAIWLVAFTAGPRAGPRLEVTRVHLALGAYLACALLSVVLNAHYLNQTGELALTFKKIPLLVSYLSVLVIVASSVRRTEVPAFMTYTLVLAVICAIGIVWESRVGENLFNVWSEGLLPPFFTFVADTSGGPLDALGRRWISGPTAYGVEAIGMLAMALAIAVVGMMGTTTRRRQILYGLAIVLLLAGIFATERKSALVAPVAVFATLAYFRRRELLSLAPLGLVIAVLVVTVSPGAVHGVVGQFTREDRSTVATVSDRAADYDAIRPDVWTHLLFGRGFGSYNHETYRILDSEILGRVVETGVLGLVAFLMIPLSLILVSRKTISLRDPKLAPVALCGTAAAICFAVISALYDVMSFPHGPYAFLCIAGLVTVVIVERREETSRRPHRTREHAFRVHGVRAQVAPGGARRRASTSTEIPASPPR